MTVYSLRRRLLGWLLISTLIIGILALTDTYREAVSTANTVSDRVLAGSALAIAEQVLVDAGGQLSVDIPYSALEMLSSAAQDRVFYRIDQLPGEMITGYVQLPPPAVQPPGDHLNLTDGTFATDPIRIATLYRAATTGLTSIPFAVTVAETTSARRALTQTILLHSAFRLALMIAGAALIVWISVTISLRPLYQLGDAIALRSPEDLRPIDQDAPSEVRGLVDTVNSFMTRLQTALSALHNFTGNAGHQLRTPLAIIRTQLALAARASTLQDAQAAAAKGDAALGHAERILTQLLLLARVNAAGSQPLTLHPLDLTELAGRLTADLVPAAAAARIDLGFEATGAAYITAEPLLIGELLGNLISNAIAYAGPGADVTVRVLQGEVTVLEVEDTGPGIPPARRAAVRQRFARGAVQSATGMGLGLPIIEEIAALFHGTLVLETGKTGHGLRARVIFPGTGRR